MGWDGVAAGGLEVHCTPGDHLTRHLHGGVAQQLRRCLESAQVASRAEALF
jgi:hypothetical protein